MTEPPLLWGCRRRLLPYEGASMSIVVRLPSSEGSERKTTVFPRQSLSSRDHPASPWSKGLGTIAIYKEKSYGTSSASADFYRWIDGADHPGDKVQCVLL
jgi:hypothetical protein